MEMKWGQAQFILNNSQNRHLISIIDKSVIKINWVKWGLDVH